MKLVLFSTCIFIFNLAFFSQYTYKLRIIDTRGAALQNVKVKGVNKSITLEETTNTQGQATFYLTTPGVYTFSYLEEKNIASFTVREGARGSGSKTVCYDPQKIFETEPKVDREGMKFRTLPSNKNKKTRGSALVIVKVMNKRKSPISNLKLKVVSCKDKIKYSARTNDFGEVQLYLPVNQTYEVDIKGMEAYNIFKIGNYPNGKFKEFITFEQTIIKEKIKGDTISQNNITQNNGTSTHKLYQLILKDYNGRKLSKEPVYLKAENSSIVYKGITNESGVAKFLVKKGCNYIVSLKYEQGIDLVDAQELSGFSLARVTRRYRGSNEIELMKAELKRQAEEAANGYVTKHRETPIRVAEEPSGFLSKTAKGFDVNFNNSGPIGTPTVVDGKLYVQEGFYSPNFYCLDAKSGQYLWGVELGESGISPIVHKNGVLLINTYSCTLYAIDASSGRLLWSKWLAGTIYSTPSADNESVYVVYDNGGVNPKNTKESYVITSFDLRTGKLNWINWLDKEVISCPVLIDEEVHLASQSGNYYVFNSKTGELMKQLKGIKAITSPTITKEHIYITTGIEGKESLTMLNRKTLQKNKKSSTVLNPYVVSNLKHEAFKTMNFNGARPIVYKNKVVVLFDSTSVSVFSSNTEKFLWTKKVKVNSAQIPVVLNDKILVGDSNGDLISFDIYTGNKNVLEKVKHPIDGQPISSKGLIYIATGGVLSIIKSLSNYQFSQWNKNAAHNLYWE